MVLEESQLEAVRDCCRDEVAFQRLQQLLPPHRLNLESTPAPQSAHQAELEHQLAACTAQLQAQAQELQQLRQLKQVVWHTVAHELRTSVIGTVLAFKQLLKQPGDCLSLPRSMAEQIVRGGDRHLNLLNSLLEAWNCQEQGIALNLQSTDFGELMTAITQELQPLLQEHQARLELQIPADLPLVQADALQIQRVFDHLLCNVLKHHPPDLHLTVQATVTDTLLRCEIQTTALNLAPTDCHHLFELQIRTPRSRCSTGIGVKLYLCREIIQAHGGQVGAFSAPERGTTFWFTLPLARPHYQT